MSIYYELTEKMDVKNLKNNAAARKLADEFLARVISLGEADKEHKLFSVSLWEEDGTEKIFDCLSAEKNTELKNADCFSLSASFWLNRNKENEELLPFDFITVLENAPENVFENLSYACYNKADCENDIAGIIVFYGFRDGTLRKGPAKMIPYDLQDLRGSWRNPETAVMIEDYSAVNVSYARVLELCRSLMTLSSYDTLEEKNGTLYYAMNNAVLTCPEDVRNFIAWVEELNRIIKPDQDVFVNICTEFVNDAADPKILSIDFSSVPAKTRITE